MNLSPLAVGLIVASFTGLLAGIGWLLNLLITTHKSLSMAITSLSDSISEVSTELRVAMTAIEERGTAQKTLCQLYRNQIDTRNKGIDIKLNKIEHKIENINIHQNQTI